ncbi:MAG: methionine gamma-lyase family protein [Clostridia bacterium]|nr:methionine gamma-lyase family protein [Clostridia bacterium]
MFEIDEKVKKLCREAEESLSEQFSRIDAICKYNTEKVHHAFYKNRVSETHFIGTTGYGYSDRGRDDLDRVYADAFECEDALVRHSIVSGTHALDVALFGLLRPGKTLLSITGKPYDTLDEIIGIAGKKGQGSLIDFGVNYRQVELKDGRIDTDAAIAAMDDSVSVVFVQRSKGYASDRRTLTSWEIGEAARKIKEKYPNAAVLVDNCYGEFVEEHEPVYYGADVIVGSLIKNPGGSLAKGGGYMAGRADLIELISYRLTSPGIGREVGASMGQNLDMYRGFYMAPHITAQALKTSVFCAEVYRRLGFSVSPAPDEIRSDIILAITLGSAELLCAFCQGIQMGAPVDSFVRPEPWDMPGYQDKVIMAAGAFIQGASIELSADGPMREPFIAYVQGGITWESGYLGVMLSVEKLYSEGLIKI